MAEQIRGSAVFWGIGSSFAASGTGIAGTGVTNLPQSVELEKKAEKDVRIENYRGECISRIFVDEMNALKVEVIPSADTIAHVKAGCFLPSVGALVTIVDTDDTQVAGTNSGKYLFISGTQRRTNNGAMVLTFMLEQFVANDVTATPS